MALFLGKNRSKNKTSKTLVLAALGLACDPEIGLKMILPKPPAAYAASLGVYADVTFLPI